MKIPIFGKKVSKNNTRRTDINPIANNAFSYYRSGKTNERQLGTRSTTRQNRVVLFLSNYRASILKSAPEALTVIIIFICLLNVLLLSPSVKVVISGDDTKTGYRSKGEYIARAEQLLKESIRSRAKFLVQPEKVKIKMMESFPEIATIDVSIPVLGKKPVLYISFYQPIATVISGGKNYILHANGSIMSSTENSDSGLFNIIDKSDVELKNGSVLFSPTQIKNMRIIHAQLVANGFEVEGYELPKSPYEIDLRLKGKGYFVKFNLQGEGDLQVGVLKASMAKLNEETINEYVDVRVEDKVYYK